MLCITQTHQQLSKKYIKTNMGLAEVINFINQHAKNLNGSTP